MIVDPNIAASLQYVDPTYQTSLFVRANIYDLSGVSPVLDSTVNLTQIDNGVYAGKKVFTAGKPYLVQTLVYTDGTYGTVDQGYGQSTQEIQCIDLKTANLDAAISSRASQATVALDATVAKTADPRFANLDATVSSRLDSLGYSAPNNADIALIKAKTDNLPVDPASNTNVATRAPAATALDNTVWTGAKAAFFDAAISSRQSTADSLTQTGAIQTDIAALESDADALTRYNDLKTDIAAVESDADALTRYNDLKTDIAALDIPPGISTDLAAIKDDTELTLARIGVPLTTDLVADVNRLYVRVGAPENASIAADIAEVALGTSIIHTLTGSQELQGVVELDDSDII